MPSTNRFGSKPGLRHEREHPAGARARSRPARRGARRTRARRPAAGAMSSVSTRLLPELRRRARQRADAAPAGVDLDLLEAGGAVQLALVGRFDADLADVVGAAVVGVDALVLERRLVVLVDAADVADHVRGDIAERVLAEQARLDLHAREAEAVGGELRDLLVGEAGADRQALGIALSTEQLAEARAVARRDLDQLGELVDRRARRSSPAREDLERVGGVVAREHHAVAVDDQAAVGHDRHDRDAVVLGLRVVVLVLDHLQVDEARQQDARTRRARRCRRRRGAAGTAAARARSCAARRCSSGSDRSSVRASARRCGISSSQVTSGQSSAPASGPTSIAQPGKPSPATTRTSSDDRLRRPAARADVQRLQPRAEPQDAAREPDAEEREQRVGERVLAEQHAVAGVGEQAEHPGRRRGRPGAAGARTRTPAPARRSPAPARRSRHGRRLRNSAQRERRDDGARAHRQQDLRSYRAASASFAPSAAAASSRRSLPAAPPPGAAGARPRRDSTST